MTAALAKNDSRTFAQHGLEDAHADSLEMPAVCMYAVVAWLAHQRSKGPFVCHGLDDTGVPQNAAESHRRN
jgi:hypothetical protein